MPVIVSLLRGVNVGGRQMKMDALCELYESLGLRHVQTLLRSGNVISTVSARELPRVAARIEKAIERSFGFQCDVIVRSAAELRETLARNPFAERPGIDPAKLLVTFLAGAPDPDGSAKVLALKIDPEELYLDGRTLYGYFPNGLAETKLSWPSIGKSLKTAATGRNLSTVQKLLALAEQLEASQ